LSLPLALVFALGGGLLLNLMPCVFPVLSLKALALVTSGAHNRAAVRREGVAFAAGVIVAFVMLGAAIVGLRAAGEQLGWGFQLQSPAVVSALALLFFVMALNLSGVFEFATLVPSALAFWSHSNRNANAFASGLLAVAIASPCTAPFMGAALGYALAENANVTFAVFVALGIGMALPYVALAWFPAWRRVLPRPGAWMVQLKQLLAFPLYATVAWLVWVLGAGSATRVMRSNARARRVRAMGVADVSGGGRFAWATRRSSARSSAAIAWPLLARSRPARRWRVPRSRRPMAGSVFGTAPGQLVARDRYSSFTAAWCVTCQVNKRLVLADAGVRGAFARVDAVAARRLDAARSGTTALSGAAGRSSVPVYVLYRKGGEPRAARSAATAALIAQRRLVANFAAGLIRR
jgi:thiol:disulfide interchange protein DsbD